MNFQQRPVLFRMRPLFRVSADAASREAPRFPWRNLTFRGIGTLPPRKKTPFFAHLDPSSGRQHNAVQGGCPRDPRGGPQHVATGKHLPAAAAASLAMSAGAAERRAAFTAPSLPVIVPRQAAERLTRSWILRPPVLRAPLRSMLGHDSGNTQAKGRNSAP